MDKDKSEILPENLPKELKEKLSIVLVCPQCGEEIIISNLICTSEYATKNPDAKFQIAFRQIFYDIICCKCGVICNPKEKQ